MLDLFPEEFHNRLIRDDQNNFWISCQMRSQLNRGDDNYYPQNAFLVLESFSNSENGTIIFEN